MGRHTDPTVRDYYCQKTRRSVMRMLNFSLRSNLIWLMRKKNLLMASGFALFLLPLSTLPTSAASELAISSAVLQKNCFNKTHGRCTLALTARMPVGTSITVSTITSPTPACRSYDPPPPQSVRNGSILVVHVPKLTVSRKCDLLIVGRLSAGFRYITPMIPAKN
jgi:disulfide bond formation protein DsbB